jgi:hypothetical protein
MIGGAAAGQNVIIQPASNDDAAKEVYLVQMVHGTEHTSPFDLNPSTGIWSTTYPLTPAVRRTIIIRYSRPLRPNALKLDLLIQPSAPSAHLIFARPQLRSECNEEDSDALSESTSRLAEAREAAHNIVQIDHLLSNRQYHCPEGVPRLLLGLRLENMRYLRRRIPAIYDLQGM